MSSKTSGIVINAKTGVIKFTATNSRPERARSKPGVLPAGTKAPNFMTKEFSVIV